MFKEILDDECGSGVTADLEGVNSGGVVPFPEGAQVAVRAEVGLEEELLWAACAAFFASLFKSSAK